MGTARSLAEPQLSRGKDQNMLLDVLVGQEAGRPNAQLFLTVYAAHATEALKWNNYTVLF